MTEVPLPQITVVAIMQDEAHYVDRWLGALGLRNGRSPHFDEVIVLDGGSTDDTVVRLRSNQIRVQDRLFENDFAAQRNAVETFAHSDWVFHMDADEIPSLGLLSGLRSLVNGHDEAGFDCVGIPRLNFIGGVLQPGPGHRGLDFQYRLKRKGLPWVGRVHEEVHGRTSVELQLVQGHFLIHDKAQERHAARNELYDAIAAGGT